MDASNKHYGAEAETCDFVQDAAGSRGLINKWVQDQTNDKIKDLIPDGFINELTRLILVNAIYFKGILLVYEIILLSKCGHFLITVPHLIGGGQLPVVTVNIKI